MGMQWVCSIKKQNVPNGYAMGMQITVFFLLSFDI